MRKGSFSPKMKLFFIIIILFIAIETLALLYRYNGPSQSNGLPSTQSVIVTAVNLIFNGTTISSLNGFTNNSGSSIYYTFLYSSPVKQERVTISSISTNTVGFSVLSVSPILPQTIGSGANASFTVKFGLPSGAYVGTLDIIISPQINMSNSAPSNNATGFGGFSIISYSCSVYRGFSVVLLNNKNYAIIPINNPTIRSSTGLSTGTTLRFSTNSLVAPGNTFNIENATDVPCGATTGLGYNVNLSFSYSENDINYTSNSTVQGKVIG